MPISLHMFATYFFENKQTNKQNETAEPLPSVKISKNR